MNDVSMIASDNFVKCLTGQVSLPPMRWLQVFGKAYLLSMAGSILVLVAEPEHTASLPLLSALGLWFSHFLIMLLMFSGTIAALLRLRLPDPLSVVAAALLLPAIFAPVSMVLDYGFGNPDDELISSVSLTGAYFSEVVAVAPMTMVAALFMAAALYYDALSRERPIQVIAPAMPSLNALIEAIPVTLGNDLIRLHAQDHYVEVVTTEGRTLIMERFNDCVERLAGIDGIQCHRSHWIRLSHVQNLSRFGSAYICTLDNGDKVPVSRRRYADLKKRVNGR